MRAKTSFFSKPVLWLTVTLVALAPLACIMYCRITHEVAHRAMHHTIHDAGAAPLSDMQQLVHAVTDALPLQFTWVALMIVVALHVSLRVVPLQRAQVPPTPPPKCVAIPLTFC